MFNCHILTLKVPVIEISNTLMNVLQCDLLTSQPLPILRHDLEIRARSQQAGSVARQASSDKLPDVDGPVKQAPASKPAVKPKPAASEPKLPTVNRRAVTRKPATHKPSAAPVELPAVEQEVTSRIPACVDGEFSRRHPKLKLKKPGRDILDGLCKGVNGGQGASGSAGELSRRYPNLKLKKPGRDILDSLCKGVGGGQGASGSASHDQDSANASSRGTGNNELIF